MVRHKCFDECESGLPVCAKSTETLNFRKVNEIKSERCLFFGDELLDQFLLGLHPGYVFLLYGSSQCLAVSLHLSVRVQLDFQKGGLQSRAVFIDAGNSFDPYLAVQYGEKYGLDRDHVLDRIFVSRAFTCHESTSLITEALRSALRKYRARLAIISDVIELYRDPDVRNIRCLDLFKTALNSMVSIARAEKAIILATSLNEDFGLDRFLHAAKERVDVILRFKERHSSTRLVLEKHPTCSTGSLLLKKSTPRVLEEFLEVTTDR